MGGRNAVLSRSAPIPHQQPRLTRAPAEARPAIEDRIAKRRAILERPIRNPDELRDAEGAYWTWDDGNRALLGQLFSTGEVSRTYTRMASLVGYDDAPFPRAVEFWANEVRDQLRKLDGVLEQLPFYDTHQTLVLKPDRDGLARMGRTLSRFHGVERQLQRRHDSRPTLLVQDEYDVQDLLHALLRLDFDDIRSEEWTPSYAGRASRMDFLLKEEQVVIEVKMTRAGRDDAQLGDELAVDVVHYGAHPDCRTLVCFIYDPEGEVRNPAGLKTDLERFSSAQLRVIVAIAPS
jgi:hypothetical protein